jgi:hypothetical protein
MRRLYRTWTRLAVLAFILFWACGSYAGALDNLTSPVPVRKIDSVCVVMQLNIPAGIIGITGSNVPGKKADTRILSCIGCGPSLQWQQWTGKNYTIVAITAAALFFPNAAEAPFPWDIGAGLIVTAYGYGIGIGYNAGLVPGNSINRLVGMLIYDINAPWKNK